MVHAAVCAALGRNLGYVVPVVRPTGPFARWRPASSTDGDSSIVRAADDSAWRLGGLISSELWQTLVECPNSHTGATQSPSVSPEGIPCLEAGNEPHRASGAASCGCWPVTVYVGSSGELVRRGCCGGGSFRNSSSSAMPARRMVQRSCRVSAVQ